MNELLTSYLFLDTHVGRVLSLPHSAQPFADNHGVAPKRSTKFYYWLSSDYGMQEVAGAISSGSARYVLVDLTVN